MLVKMWRNRISLHCWWECKLLQPLWKTVWRFLKKLKIELPSNCTTRHLSKGYRCAVSKGHMHSHVINIAALSTIAKVWKEPTCPSMDEWIKKM